MEPYPQVSRHGRHTVDEWLEFMDLFGLDSKKTSKKGYEPTEEELLAEKRMARCDEFSNRLLWATVEKFGDKLGSWNGDVAVDGTAFKVSAKGNPNKQDMLAGRVPGHRKVASTPTLGNYSKGADDHNGDAKPSKGDNMWAGEATFATMEGDGVGREGGLPSLILGMSFHRPGAKPWQRALRSLTNVFARPELPPWPLPWRPPVPARPEGGEPPGPAPQGWLRPHWRLQKERAGTPNRTRFWGCRGGRATLLPGNEGTPAPGQCHRRLPERPH